MKERILEFLKKENKSSSVFAEEIGVQPSGISHILSGRNNPSLDFVIKMLERYPYLSTEWLLFGKGSMYKDKNLEALNTLFDVKDDGQKEIKKEQGSYVNKINDEKSGSKESSGSSDPEVRRIVWFYNDNSFEEFYIRKK